MSRALQKHSHKRQHQCELKSGQFQRRHHRACQDSPLLTCLEAFLSAGPPGSIDERRHRAGWCLLSSDSMISYLRDDI